MAERMNKLDLESKIKFTNSYTDRPLVGLEDRLREVVSEQRADKLLRSSKLPPSVVGDSTIVIYELTTAQLLSQSGRRP